MQEAQGLLGLELGPQERHGMLLPCPGMPMLQGRHKALPQHGMSEGHGRLECHVRDLLVLSQMLKCTLGSHLLPSAAWGTFR